MTLPALWQHQTDSITELDAALDRGETRLIVKLPTGAGKTRLASEFITRKGYYSAGCQVAFCVPRLSLINQTVRAFQNVGMQHVGVIQRQHYLTDPDAPVQICSVQTLSRRVIPQFDLIFLDEAHIGFKKIFKWIDDPKIQHVPVIGLTATPWSKGLGNHFGHLINVASISSLIVQKILVPFDVYAPPGPDLSKVRTVAGDYHEGDLSAACDKILLVANIVETWQQRGENRPTILFAIDRKHARHLEERFLEAGVSAEYIDALTSVPDREAIFQRLESGETKIISSIGTLEAGIDLPFISCCIDARPTKSVIRLVQSLGRGLRTAADKLNLIILDHAGNSRRLGLIDTIDSDVLDDGEANVSAERDKNRADPAIQTCPECHRVLPRPKPPACPQCGHEFFNATKYQESLGKLVRYGSKELPPDGRYFLNVKQRWYAELLGLCRQNGNKPGRAFFLYLEKFKEQPPSHWRSSIEPIPPGREVKNFVRSRAIAYAMARKKYG